MIAGEDAFLVMHNGTGANFELAPHPGPADRHGPTGSR